MDLFYWLTVLRKKSEGLVMRISTADEVNYDTIAGPSESDIWDALVKLPVSYDSLYFTYGGKESPRFIFVEYENGKYRLEHDTADLDTGMTNVARVSQDLVRDIIYHFAREHTVEIDEHWEQEKVR